ncbi:response regulator [Paenibacillus sp. GCM10023252]|uniref:response regulator transcription factor n=1 Tax=Paenibacillus sp. GCM10023252 TaxID=3252649 RepID=UPI003612E965
MLQVLLVEDEASIRSGLKKLIEEVIGGFVVAKEAENGREALGWLRTSAAPDLLITDIRMKELNGLDLIDQVRELLPDLPILIISGYNDFEYAKRAMKNRVSDYILKPVDRVELSQYLTRIRQQLAGSSRNEESDPMTAALESPSPEAAASHPVIRRVLELVRERLHLDVSLQAIATIVHLNPQYLSALFKQEVGRNFIEYVTECRMEKAKQLLRDTGLKIYEVGEMSGYTNAKHFMSVFKSSVGQTPGEYRETIKNKR